MAGKPGFRINTDWCRPDFDLISRCREFPPATLADAMHRLGAMTNQIRPVWAGASCVGSALTVWVRAGDNLMVHKALNMANPGDVIVINGEGDSTRALFGELMGRSAKALDVAGVILDGAVRDADGLFALELPVFARAVTPAGPFKYGPGEIGRPVACGGVVCNSGDIVTADRDGVVVVPQVDAPQVIAVASEIQNRETRRQEEIDAGNPQREGIDQSLIAAGILPGQKDKS